MNYKRRGINNEKLFINILLFIIYLIALYPLTKIGITTSDDMDIFLFSHDLSSLINLNHHYAFYQGRFYFLITRYIYALPYLIDSPLYFNAFYIFPFIGSFVLFVRLIERVFSNSSLTLFSAVFITSIFQISYFYSITVAYPFFFTFSFCLMLISLHLILNYYNTKKYYLIILSSILILITYLFYEVFLSYFVIHFFIVLWKNKINAHSSKQDIKKAFKDLLPFIIGITLYLIVYFLFRFHYQTNYYGNDLSREFNFFVFLESAFKLGLYSFPLKVFTSNIDLLENYSLSFNNLFNFLQIDLIYFVQGIIVSLLSFHALDNYKKIGSKKLFYFFVAGILFYILPLMPVVITSKYYDNNYFNYVPTFFALFGVLTCFTTLILLIINLLSNIKILRLGFIVIICISIFFVSLFSNYTNSIVAKDWQYSNYRLKMVKDIFKDDLSLNLINYPICMEQAQHTSSIYGKGNTVQCFSWNKYIKRVSSKNINSFEKYKTFYQEYKNTDSIVFVCFFRQAFKNNDALMYFVALKGKNLPENQEDIITNRIIVYYLSPYKSFNISIASKAVNNISINNIPISELSFFHSLNLIMPLDKEINFFEIRGKELMASSLNVSNMLNKESQYININSKTLNDEIKFYIMQIKNNPEAMNFIEEKSRKYNNSLEEQLYQDAKWVLEMRLNK